MRYNKRYIAYGILACIALAALAGLGIGTASYYCLYRPGTYTQTQQVLISPGSSASEIARTLHAHDVIPCPHVWHLWLRSRQEAASLHAGEYRFTPGMSAQDVLHMLQRGDVVVRRITIAEGRNSRQILALLQQTEGLTGPVPARPEEGTLLPETYHYTYGDSYTVILKRMRTAMTRTLNELWPKRAENLPLRTVKEALTLASIVEKETAKPEERGLIAAVYLNRLRRGMLLQADPTVRYAVERAKNAPLERPLRYDDLRIDNPYNTYRYVGLPPGPIAHPGRDALQAVLNPPASDMLYFVADGQGGHRFARTYREHQRNVALYRRWQREQRKKKNP